jgi:ribosomal protein S17
MMDTASSINMMDTTSSQRGKLEGVVINNVRQHEGTITVMVASRKPHKKYHKITTTHKKYLVQYNEKNIELPIGAVVRLIQIAPVSKKKCFQIETILQIKR